MRTHGRTAAWPLAVDVMPPASPTWTRFSRRCTLGASCVALGLICLLPTTPASERFLSSHLSQVSFNRAFRVILAVHLL